MPHPSARTTAPLADAKLTSLLDMADQLRDASQLMLKAAEAIEDLTRAVQSPTQPTEQLDAWFRDLRGERAADFLISFEPHLDHHAAEVGRTMLGNGWMPAGAQRPTHNARGALERLVQKGLAKRVGPSLYRTTRKTPLLYDIED